MNSRRNADVILQNLMQEVAINYADDAVAPGVVVSWLARRLTFYASVRRYAVQSERVLRADIVTAYESTSFDAAVRGLALNWRRSLRVPQRERLPNKNKATNWPEGSWEESW